MDFKHLTDKHLVDTYMHLMYTRATTMFSNADWDELFQAAMREIHERKIKLPKEEDYK